MNIKLFPVLIFFLLLFSCGVNSQPRWDKLEYYYNVGSLPPPYHYSYKIIITNDGIVDFEYLTGYVKTDSNLKKYNFTLSSVDLKSLKKAVKESNVINLKIEMRPNDEIPDGGHSESLEIFDSDGEKISSVPSYPELKYQKKLEKLYKAIQNCVPENIWNEVRSLHKD